MPVDADAAPAVVVDDVRKTFNIPRDRVHTLKERALHPLRRGGVEPLRALDGVSFSVQPGEFFGIVGRNGSGKSTLLKCMAGIYRVDQGAIYMNGRVSTFIELGVGFNPDLPARDNVALNGIMLGLPPREARERFERVIEFAELQDFVDLKLKNYSSGMQVRLAFSVMIQVDADILLIDEVLAVGDAAFQQKCFDVFHRLRDEGKTILFVTHDMASVQRFCHRALLLERGAIVALGEPDEVANSYVELNFGREAQADRGAGGTPRYGDAAAEIADAWFEDEHGERRETLPQGRPCTFRARVVFHRPAEHPGVAVVFENEQRHPLFATSTVWIDEETGHYAAGEEVVFSVALDNVFAPGKLYASPWIAYRGGRDIMDRRPRMTHVMVTGIHVSGGLVDLPHDVALERSNEQISASRQP